MLRHDANFSGLISIMSISKSSYAPTRRDVLHLLGLGGLGGTFVFSAAGLSGCAGGLDGLKGYEMSLESLRESMAGFFPLNRRMLEIFDVGLGVPKLALQPTNNRIGTELDMSVGTESMFLRKSFTGNFGISSGLRYEPTDRSLRLASVRSDKLSLSAVPSALAPQVQRIGGLLVEQVLEGYTVHKLPDKLVQGLDTLGVQLGAMKVSNTGVGFNFVPKA
jgi:hypothetical protein